MDEHTYIIPCWFLIDKDDYNFGIYFDTQKILEDMVEGDIASPGTCVVIGNLPVVAREQVYAELN